MAHQYVKMGNLIDNQENTNLNYNVILFITHQLDIKNKYGLGCGAREPCIHYLWEYKHIL